MRFRCFVILRLAVEVAASEVIWWRESVIRPIVTRRLMHDEYNFTTYFWYCKRILQLTYNHNETNQLFSLSETIEHNC